MKLGPYKNSETNKKTNKKKRFSKRMKKRRRLSISICITLNETKEPLGNATYLLSFLQLHTGLDIIVLPTTLTRGFHTLRYATY